MISGFRREVGAICVHLEYYLPHGGNSLPTFRDNVTVHLQESKNPRRFTEGYCV